MKKILIIDDQEGGREALKETFHGLYDVTAVENAVEGLSHLSREAADLVLLDLIMPRVNGIEFLKAVREIYPDLPVLVVTASSSDTLIKEALSLGATGIIRRPWDVHELRNLVRQSVAAKEASRQQELLSKEVTRDFPSLSPIGQSAVFRRMLETARSVAETHVLVTGERGVGKEYVARQIHAWSRRSSEPFVIVSCRELPATFIEAEIFGHWSASTGQVRRGSIDLARDSTLFVQDIDCLPQPVQDRLIQFLTKGEYQRQGSTQIVPSTTRVIASMEASHTDAVSSHRVSSRLVEAFSPSIFSVPPLRERSDDIPLLAHHFLHQFRQALHSATLDIAPSAMQKLREYSWPGNVRELRNVIERVLVLYGASKQIGFGELPQELQRPSASNPERIDYEASVSAYERALIEGAFERTNGTMVAAAQELGITTRQLQTRVAKLNIRRSPFKRKA
jgi:DNA-binding NtrC family response regulator